MKISYTSSLMRCFGSRDVCDIQLAINEILNVVTAENREQMRENVCYIKSSVVAISILMTNGFKFSMLLSLSNNRGSLNR